MPNVDQFDPKSSDLTTFSSFVGDIFPFVPNKYYTNPTPVHVLNNFIFMIFGKGNNNSLVNDWLKGQNLQGFLGESMQGLEANLGKVFDAIFNTDRAVYKTFKSPFPMSASVVGKDQTDAGYAESLWASFGSEGRENVGLALSQFYGSQYGNSSLAALIRKIETTPLSAPITSPMTSGTTFGRSLSEIIAKTLRKYSSSTMEIRIEVLRKLGIFLGGCIAISNLQNACNSSVLLKDKREENSNLSLVCYTGPIGSLKSEDQKLSQLAIASFSEVIDRCYFGIVETAVKRIVDERARKPNLDWKSFVDQFASIYCSGNDALVLNKYLKHYGETGLYEFVQTIFPRKLLVNSIKSIGVKSGFVWPRRNSSQPRLILDTVFLTSLTEFIAEPDMDVASFVKKVFEELGLILGLSGIEISKLTNLQHSTKKQLNLTDALYDLERKLAERLVAAGLAREYSDGTTILVGV